MSSKKDNPTLHLTSIGAQSGLMRDQNNNNHYEVDQATAHARYVDIRDARYSGKWFKVQILSISPGSFCYLEVL